MEPPEINSPDLVPVQSPDGKEWPPRYWGNPSTALDCRVLGFSSDGKLLQPLEEHKA